MLDAMTTERAFKVVLAMAATRIGRAFQKLGEVPFVSASKWKDREGEKTTHEEVKEFERQRERETTERVCVAPEMLGEDYRGLRCHLLIRKGLLEVGPQGVI